MNVHLRTFPATFGKGVIALLACKGLPVSH